MSPLNLSHYYFNVTLANNIIKLDFIFNLLHYFPIFHYYFLNGSRNYLEKSIHNCQRVLNNPANKTGQFRNQEKIRMFEQLLSVLVKWVGIKEETIFPNSKIVAFSVLATLPMMFILNSLASLLLSAVQGGVDEIVADQIKENDDEDGNEMECAICLCQVSKGEKYKILPKCNHGYHVSCIDSWLQTNPSCPICRSEVKVKCINHKGRYKILASFMRSFFEGFCKWFLGLSTDSIGDGHYIY